MHERQPIGQHRGGGIMGELRVGRDTAHRHKEHHEHVEGYHRIRGWLLICFIGFLKNVTHNLPRLIPKLVLHSYTMPLPDVYWFGELVQL